MNSNWALRIAWRRGFVVALAVWLTSTFPWTAEAQKAKEVGAIVGQVQHTCSPAPAGAFVYIPGRSFVAITGASGNFELSSVPPGTYPLHVEVTNPPDAVELPSVVVSAGQTTDVGQITLGADLQADPNNCGTCGHVCLGTPAICSAGVCVCTDADGDGYFAQPECGTLVDCNDNDPAIHPDVAEICDGKDNDCNGLVDDNLGTLTCGSGDCARTVPACLNGIPQQCVPGC